MKSSVKKDSIFIHPGTVIIGKWHKKRYEVKQKIGSGMIGTVYLCRTKGRFVALKISDQAMSMTTEVNVLTSLNKVQDSRLGPFLFDVDDWQTDSGKTYSFYVMEYIDGISMDLFVRQHGFEWIGVFLFQMIEQLEQLHRLGYVFGDLKNENILVTPSPPRIRFIDVGGTTKMGRSVKEYTAFYDRAYWQLGSRKAEPSYDLFAVVMVLLTVCYPKQFKRTKDSKRLLIQKIDRHPSLTFYARILENALLGKYRSAVEMKDELMEKIVWKEKSKNFHKHRKYGIESLLTLAVSAVYYLLYYVFSS